jgi:tetratricopeptide (TPR) repeat protein
MTRPPDPMGPRPWVAPTPPEDGDPKTPHAAEESQRDREDAKAYNERGKSFMDEGMFDRAVEAFTEVIRLRPRSDVAYFNRGTAYLAQGRHEAALVDFNRAIQINPKDAAYYDNRGTAYARSGDYDSAIADYTEAIWLEPNNAQTYRKRGDGPSATTSRSVLCHHLPISSL